MLVIQGGFALLPGDWRQLITKPWREMGNWCAPAYTCGTFDLCKLALGKVDGWDLSLADICSLLLRSEPIILKIWF